MLKKPILHIAADEKFIDAAYEIYERAFPGKNIFIILQTNESGATRHVSENLPYQFISIYENYIEKLLNITSDAKLVVCHGLNTYQAQTMSAISDLNAKKVWSAYGAEVYKNPCIINYNIYGNITTKRYIRTKKSYFKKIVRRYYHKLFKGIKNRFKQTENAMREADFVSTLYEEEFSFYKSLNILDKKAKFLKFTYYPLNIIINENVGRIKSNNILLGNSATYSNNHLEAFAYLKKLDIKDQKIISPLSYGDDNYAKDIIKIGNETFGQNFSPLKEFYPLNQYIKIIQGCGIVIMNHYRQQAVGNILHTLFQGAKVYLSNKSTLYDYLKRIGCYVFCIEENLKPDNQDVFMLLDQEQMEHNRRILKKELSVTMICNELKSKLSSIIE